MFIIMNTCEVDIIYRRYIIYVVDFMICDMMASLVPRLDCNLMIVSLSLLRKLPGYDPAQFLCIQVLSRHKAGHDFCASLS